MTIDEFREALGMLIVDSKPIPIKDVLEALEEECEGLRGELLSEDNRPVVEDRRATSVKDE